MSKIKIKRLISLDLELLSQNNLSITEWILCEQIQFLSARKGYCYAKRETLAEAIKIGVRGLQKMIARLEKDGYIERVDYKNLRVGEKWLKMQEFSTKNHEQSSRQPRTKFTATTNKVHPLL